MTTRYCVCEGRMSRRMAVLPVARLRLGATENRSPSAANVFGGRTLPQQTRAVPAPRLRAEAITYRESPAGVHPVRSE